MNHQKSPTAIFLISGESSSKITLREEIFAGINFRKLCFDKHFAGINFRKLSLSKDLAGINFRQSALYKDFAGINFRESALFKDFAVVNLTYALRHIFLRP